MNDVETLRQGIEFSWCDRSSLHEALDNLVADFERLKNAIEGESAVYQLGYEDGYSDALNELVDS